MLVYIQKEVTGSVFIDVVETTKNGHSYKLNGDIWNRGANVFGRENCKNQHGVEWKIIPLRRDHTPAWVIVTNVIVCPDAKERYNLWLKRSLNLKE